MQNSGARSKTQDTKLEKLFKKECETQKKKME